MPVQPGLPKLGWLLFDKPKLRQTHDYLEQREDLLTPGTSACLGCSGELGLRFTMRVLGRNSIVAIPPSCMSGIGGRGSGNLGGAKICMIGPLLTNTSSMLTGIKRHFQRRNRDVHVVAFCGDGATADAGFQSLSGAAERDENIIYICNDNEGYMNTGVQRSSTTPYKAWTTTTPVGPQSSGKPEQGKDMPLIMAMHGASYVATATMAYPADYRRKLERAMSVTDGLSYLHLFSPCPPGWGFESNKTIEVSRLAVETNFAPLWECDHGKFRITKRMLRRHPIRDYLASAGKYRHLTQNDIQEIQRIVDRKFRRLNDLTHVHAAL